MKRYRISLSYALILLLLLGLQTPINLASGKIQPESTEAQATGLLINSNSGNETAGLGFNVSSQQGWPLLKVQGGVTRSIGNFIAGPVGLELGIIKNPGISSASITNQNADWSHNLITFGSGVDQVKFWASRLSPAILIQSTLSNIRLFSGPVRGDSFDGVNVTTLPPGPSYPKYFSSFYGGSIHVQTLSQTAIPINLDKNWLLVWYGNNSRFVDTNMPLNYSGYDFETASLPQKYAYQADIPVLITFDHKPSSIKLSSEGGIDLGFSGGSNYLSVLPIYGRNHLRTSETETWSTGLPAPVIGRINWWASHMCSFPESTQETSSYNESNDEVTFQETINFITVCQNGTLFSPIPPVLALVKDSFPMTFSGPVVNSNLTTEFGPYMGIENTSTYSWKISGLGKYTYSKQYYLDANPVPPEVNTLLSQQIQKIISGGHYAPWIYADTTPNNGWTFGQLYWLNPGDALLPLIEAAGMISDSSLKNSLLTYINSEMASFPLEDTANLPLDQGKIRGSFADFGTQVVNDYLNFRPELFFKSVPLSNFYVLSRYYSVINSTPSQHVWNRANAEFLTAMSEKDWATFSKFKGFEGNDVAVVNANRDFSGILGYVTLAHSLGDSGSTSLGMAALTKAVILRLGMAKYPRYLYSVGLATLPLEPDWQVKMLAGKWLGAFFNFSWIGPNDDPRQVKGIDQFGVTLDELSTTVSCCGKPEGFNSHLIAFSEMVPQLSRILKEFAFTDVQIYIRKMEVLYPHWYAAFAEAGFGFEHNLNLPTDSLQIFLAKIWIQGETPERMIKYLDIPWLEDGDLFFIQKLITLIQDYRGMVWNPLILSGFSGDKQVSLNWTLANVNLPSQATWRIEYTDNKGNNNSINNIPLDYRNYIVSSLTNGTSYSFILKAVDASNTYVTSNSLQIMPTKWRIILPFVRK